MGSRCVARPPHLPCVGTAVCGSHQDGTDPAYLTDLSSWGGCGASFLRGLRTGTLRKSQTNGELGGGWGGSEGTCPLQSDCASVNVSGSDASPGPKPLPDLLWGSSAHRCALGSSLYPGHRSLPGSSDKGLLHHHQRNAGTCYG